MNLFDQQTERKANRFLANWLSSRGFDYKDDAYNEHASCYSIEAHDHEMWVYVEYQGSYSNNILTTLPLFTRSLDSISFVIQAMTGEERATYRYQLIRKSGFGFGEGAVDATAEERAYAALFALGGLK